MSSRFQDVRVRSEPSSLSHRWWLSEDHQLSDGQVTREAQDPVTEPGVSLAILLMLTLILEAFS